MKPQTSYLGCPCEECRRPIIAFTIAATMPTPAFTSETKLTLRCTDCGHEQQCDGTALRRYEEPQVH